MCSSDLGVFSDYDPVPGQFEGMQYNEAAKNLRPDHLALLPGGTGACSWDAGCGIRANSNKKGGTNVKKEFNEMIESLSQAGYSIHEIGTHATSGYKDLIDDAYNILRGMEGTNNYYYLEEIFSDYLVYQVNELEGSSKMYKHFYQLKDGEITLVGEPIEVRKEVSFIVLEKNKKPVRTKFSSSINKVKEVKTMEKEKVKAPCCEDLVNELITNERTKFTEEDKERLLTMEEAFLVKLIPDKVEEVVKEPIANEELEKVVEKEEVKEAVNTLSAEDQAALAYGRKQLKERRETMIKGIQNNAGEAFPSTVLETYDEETLERIFKAVTKEEVADYSLKSSIKPLANNEQEPLYPGGIEIESK